MDSLKKGAAYHSLCPWHFNHGRIPGLARVTWWRTPVRSTADPGAIRRSLATLLRPCVHISLETRQ
ncbi:MAG: hypothetical protein ABII26_13475, partial [Pseudomonadota bacterium]